MSFPGDENPNPQWQRPKEEKPQWTSGDALGDRATSRRTWRQQPPQSERHATRSRVWQEQQRPQQYPARRRRRNGLAIASLILSISSFVALPLIGSIAGVVCGHIGPQPAPAGSSPARATASRWRA